MSCEIDLESALDAAIDAACEAGAEIRRSFGKVLTVEAKTSEVDLVTQVDREVEGLLAASLRKRFPSFGFLGEEGGRTEATTGSPLWVVDPLDGTNNFVRGFPYFAVSIALMHGDDALVGVVLNPMTEELFTAVKGSGSRLNGRPIHVDTQERVATSLLSTRTPRGAGGTVENLEHLSRVASSCLSVRNMGAAALEMAYVAAGRLSGYWELQLNPWDFAGALLLVEQAGGRVTRVDGSSCTMAPGTLVATNGQIHGELLTLLDGSETVGLNARDR